MSKSIFGCLVLAAALFGTAHARDTDAKSDTGARYTFSWPLDSAAERKPRGGMPKGVPVTLAVLPAREWVALQAPDLTKFERDRRAILAMAGTYRVTFDFLEVVPFVAGQERRPYQSWGTEKVYVDRDTGGTISLVHILEMRVLNDDGSIGEPLVTKHWRQDWQYEPRHVVEYQGCERWRRRAVTAKEAKGRWLQTVSQVDESPRYASIGSWEHSSSFSTWLSGDTWRPLPRREWSVRDDYQVLIGTNRHTVFATGWTQEENNLKTALTPDRAVRGDNPYLAREYGMARYERIEGQFAAADQYYAATKSFWDEVRGTWTDAFAKQGTITLQGPVDKLGLFRPLFSYADAVQSGTAQGDAQSVIRVALREMGALR